MAYFSTNLISTAIQTEDLFILVWFFTVIVDIKDILWNCKDAIEKKNATLP